MSALVEKIRRAREQRVTVGKHTFVIRRPTDLEMLRIGQSRQPEDVLAHVVGWDGVTEGDIINGGDPHPMPFDAEACAEWLQDRMDLFGPVSEAIFKAFADHRQALDDAAKN